MSAYFSTPARCGRLAAAAMQWLGTPFVAHASIRGAGVDCVHLCGCLYIEAGALDVFDPPAYSLDGGKHLSQSLVLKWLDKSDRFKRVDEVHFGDLLVFLTKGVEHHVGVKLDGETFVHAIKDYGVVEGNIVQDSTYAKCLRAIYRPMEL